MLVTLRLYAVLVNIVCALQITGCDHQLQYSLKAAAPRSFAFTLAILTMVGNFNYLAKNIQRLARMDDEYRISRDEGTLAAKMHY